MIQLNNCPHCGGKTDFIVDTQGTREAAVFAQCSSCKTRTIPIVASLDYSAKDKIAEIWNPSTQVELDEIKEREHEVISTG